VIGRWAADLQILPVCISRGKTKQLAIQNIREALEGHILALRDDDLVIPSNNFDAVLIAA
jgi:predicted RNase H-like HicB family nuclease